MEDRAQRQVYLPLQNPSICSHCGEDRENLSICTKCGETAYCNDVCQKKDWPAHKGHCGKKNDRVQMSSFYPMLAILMESQRLYPEKPAHPAQTHKILTPADAAVCTFPDGSRARLLLLGTEMDEARVASRPHEWWPSSSPVLRHLFSRRFSSEYFLLPSILASLVALMAEVYTTTYIPASDSPDGRIKPRVRLQHNRSLIADFGIVKGSVDAEDRNKLAYYNVEDGAFSKGQDADEHYWMYFTTASGEELILDGGLFPFNYGTVVSTPAYVKHGLPPQFIFAPVYFQASSDSTKPRIHHEKQRFSVLRDDKLPEAVRFSRESFCGRDAKIICDFMDKVAGGPMTCSQIEKQLVMTWCIDACDILEKNVSAREYLNFPEHPLETDHADPGELTSAPVQDDNEAWGEYVKKWMRKERRGEITDEKLDAEFRAWAGRKRREKVDRIMEVVLN